MFGKSLKFFRSYMFGDSNSNTSEPRQANTEVKEVKNDKTLDESSKIDKTKKGELFYHSKLDTSEMEHTHGETVAANIEETLDEILEKKQKEEKEEMVFKFFESIEDSNLNTSEMKHAYGEMKGANIEETLNEISKNVPKEEQEKEKKLLFMCVCEKVYKNKQAFYQHIRSVHGGDRYGCTICIAQDRKRSMWFYSKKQLLDHCKKAKHDIPENTSAISALQFLIEDDF